LIVVSGLSRIDNKKYRQFFHKKAKMIPFDSVEAIIGHAPGGVCPFGVNDGVDIYLDESLKKNDIYYTAAGDENYIVVTSLKDMEEVSGYKDYVDVTQSPE
jgi:prolyl-tRNA editing enzyme YbaK/EbsC (Cys-tRNA(Pro) deacylase)